MSGFSRRHLAIAALGLAALAAMPAASAPATGDMTLGSARAKVEVVEYASLTCSHCARFHTEVFPAFKKKYVDTGKVRYTLRELPTAPVDVAAAGFLMARCAGPSRYFKVVDEVFRSQPRWYEEGKGGPRAVFVQIAKANGMSEKRFADCITDPAAMKAFNGRVQQAIKAEVAATPTFVINGKVAKEGEMTLAELDAAIAQAAKGGGR